MMFSTDNFVGSSPRLRGARTRPQPAGTTPGIIPALAGSTAQAQACARHPVDHPRACGEHFDCDRWADSNPGSSPRLRGARPFRSAGNTRWDHPRACGEHCCMMFSTDNFVGSSPRLRGARTRPQPAGTTPGIIPALAGSTAQAQACARHPVDHPRACGEHFDCDRWADSNPGSSPRLRGARPFRSAGNTRWDHPRACGEHRLDAV